HTRFSRDWSSDVCSSDLAAARRAVMLDAPSLRSAVLLGLLYATSELESGVPHVMALLPAAEGESFLVDWLARLAEDDPGRAFRRSDERRVGKEGGARMCE